MRLLVLLLVVGFAALGCASASGLHVRAGGQEAGRAPELYAWLDARCSDGQLPLAGLGFERTVEVAREGSGYVLTLETELAARGCRSTSMMRVEPAPEGGYRFVPEASVTLPEGVVCGAEEVEPVHGQWALTGERMLMVLERSPWCRGFDARFEHVRVPSRAPSPEQIARRYAAQFQRGNVAALVALFSRDASLIEPLSATEDGADARHEGSQAITSYFSGVFASVAWHALRLTRIVPGEREGQLTLEWTYMDAALEAPLAGRTYLLIAGGEILQAEIQLVSEPEPRVALASDRDPRSR